MHLALFVCVFNLVGDPFYRPNHSDRHWVHYGPPRTCCVSSIQDVALNLSFAESYTCSYETRSPPVCDLVRPHPFLCFRQKR